MSRRLGGTNTIPHEMRAFGYRERYDPNGAVRGESEHVVLLRETGRPTAERPIFEVL